MNKYAKTAVDGLITNNATFKLVLGTCATLALTTSAMAYQGEVLLAPAMNTRMWQNPAVRRTCETLRSWGVHFVGPGKGRLACGDNGEGRMAEVPEILEAIRSLRPRP